jgi:ornithine carbamoyltransferase
LQSQLKLSGALFSTLPDSSQHVLNRRARRRLRQHFTQAVRDFGRDQARTQKRRHALQLRHHESARQAAALTKRYVDGVVDIVDFNPEVE